ncbi:DNA alkylation repair protein [Nocardioides anomalus]|uniref:DNA alkylation repair protein n=1 Tax=Nocardioides anomalus TaxID=2712223 RepID=A0A6G6WCM4_9ACTN|nr:DNA alkylation repair protein [Nocardioides anomalus]QIG42790.1 DNA alkylation repair protein [Nocardioides anomalus]
MAADRELVAAVRAALAAAGDEERAAGQQRYMKSALPYHGVSSPQLKTALRPLLRAWAPVDRTQWEDTVRTLWDEVTHREEWYAAIAVARHRRARAWLDPVSLELWRHLVVAGAWWDVVDEVASHLVGDVLAAHRAEATPTVRAWATDEDLWLRRTALICQLGHRGATDLDLLTWAIEQNVDDPSFWLRKAIGWALRQHARTDPDWVRAEVARLGGRLSGLSRREAMKHL